MLRRTKGGAIRRGLGFSLDLDWLLPRLRAGVCEITGLPFVFAARGPCIPSIDRKDSMIGYTPENCRLILWSLNAAFGAWGEPAFKEIATAYVAQQN